MSRKLEIRSRMAELQKEFAGLNSELKELDELDKRAAAREKYKEYLFKIPTMGYAIYEADKIEDVTDLDRENAGTGKSGLVYTGFDGKSEFGYIMLKNKEEYNRTARILKIIDAVDHIADEKEQNKEPYIKIILGEETDETK